jgi:hypothetical protein
MGATDLVERIALAGVRLTALDCDRLAAEPAEALTDDLRALIRANKPALLELLRAANEPPLESRDDAEMLAAWEMTQALFARLTAREWLARFAPERLPEGDKPENYPVAQIAPGNTFWMERARRGGRR